MLLYSCCRTQVVATLAAVRLHATHALPAGPLLVSSILHSALAAMDVCSAALAALAATSSAREADRQVEEEMVQAERAQVGGSSSGWEQQWVGAVG
jgi:hypothetical protein